MLIILYVLYLSLIVIVVIEYCINLHIFRSIMSYIYWWFLLREVMTFKCFIIFKCYYYMGLYYIVILFRIILFIINLRSIINNPSINIPIYDIPK